MWNPCFVSKHLLRLLVIEADKKSTTQWGDLAVLLLLEKVLQMCIETIKFGEIYHKYHHITTLYVAVQYYYLVANLY